MKIFLTIITLIIVTLISFFFYNRSLNKDESFDFTVEIVKDERVKRETFTLEKGESFQSVLEEKYETELRSDGILLKIDFLEAFNIYEAYIGIYKNEIYSSVGYNLLSVKEGDVVKFCYIEI